MIVLAGIGALLLSAVVCYGIWMLINSFTIKRTTNRYRYVKITDEDGNEITKVVDLEEQHDENKS
jgi:hypothetical protein